LVFLIRHTLYLKNDKYIRKVKFLGWELNVDYDLTNSTYSNPNTIGSLKSCNCDDCKNFINNINTLYPDEIKNLLITLGIDYHKPCETWRIYKDGNLHKYSGWFHFKGDFTGEDCLIIIDKEISELRLKSITENFSIGFCYKNSLTLFQNRNDLVQIEFEVKIPWTIDSPESE